MFESPQREKTSTRFTFGWIYFTFGSQRYKKNTSSTYYNFGQNYVQTFHAVPLDEINVGETIFCKILVAFYTMFLKERFLFLCLDHNITDYKNKEGLFWTPIITYWKLQKIRFWKFWLFCFLKQNSQNFQNLKYIKIYFCISDEPLIFVVRCIS